MKKHRLAVLVLVLSAALMGCTAHTDSVTDGTPEEAPYPNTWGAAAQAKTITVSADAEVKVVPDKARIGVSVENEAATAEQARAENARLYETVIESLSKLGIEKQSIQTSWTNLTPIWNYDADTETITGYAMYTRIEVSDLDIEQIGTTMQACVDAGATGIHGPSFYCTGYDEAYEQALAKAIEAAGLKAQAMASAANVRLAGVVEINESPQDSSYRYEQAATAEADTAADGGVPIHDFEPGELSVEATVSASWAIE